MFHSFNACLDQSLNQIPDSPEIRRALGTERIKLAAMKIPPGVNDETHATIRQTIDECFVFGFRRGTLIGAALALASSLYRDGDG